MISVQRSMFFSSVIYEHTLNFLLRCKFCSKLLINSAGCVWFVSFSHPSCQLTWLVKSQHSFPEMRAMLIDLETGQDLWWLADTQDHSSGL